jgi:hypothetical protein
VSISINVTPAASGGTFTVGKTSLQNITLDVTGGIGPPGTDVALAAGTGISIVQVNNTATISSTVVIPDNLADLSDVTLSNVTTGQVLAYNGTAWTAAADNALTLSTSTGADLGTAAIGTSGEAARADHVHNLPTFAEITNGTATVTGNLTLDASTGSVTLNGGTAGSASLTLNCEQNTHGVTIQSPPHSAAATYTLTLPTSDGAANQVLSTDGNGSLSWSTGIEWATEPTDSNANGTAGQIAYGSGFFYLHDGTYWRRAQMSTWGIATPTITITSQPQNLTLADGGSGNFTIAATSSDGSPVQYQWQSSDTAGISWDTMTGETSATYGVSSVTLADNATQYRVVCSAPAAPDVTSAVAVLTVTETYQLHTESGDTLLSEQGDTLTQDLAPSQAWTQVGVDIDGEAAGDMSGRSNAISGDGTVLAIGAYGNDGTGADAGHVRVYELSGSAWVQRGADIDGEAAGDQFGQSVSLSNDGTVLAVGGTENAGTGTEAGHVRVFEWTGSAWSQRGSDIDAEAAYDSLGNDVALSSDGSVLAVGAPDNDGGGTNAGHVRVYEWSGSAWSQRGSDIDGRDPNSGFGSSVSVSSNGSVVAIGAPSDDTNGTGAGSFAVFEWTGSSWAQRGSYFDGVAAQTSLGHDISISHNGNRVAVGARYADDPSDAYSQHGAVYVHEWSGSAWSQLGSTVYGDTGSDNFGISLSISGDGNTFAAGAIFADDPIQNAGYTKAYSWSGSSWVQVGERIDGEAQTDYSGISVSITDDGGRVAVGAYSDAAGTDAGHVRVFDSP